MKPTTDARGRTFVKPRPGAIVFLIDRMPPFSKLPQQGGWLNLNNNFYRRRINDGSLVLADPPAPNDSTTDGAPSEAARKES